MIIALIDNGSLEPAATRNLRALILRLRDAGHCIMFTSHVMQEVAALCDEIAIISGGRVEIDVAERALFGVDHGTIGRWLAESWGLSEAICKAIAYHHAPDGGLPEPLVAVVHISEVLSNALGLTHERQSRVSTISGPSCTRLEMEWDANSQSLFGRIEARSRHAFNPFAPEAPSTEA